MAGRIFHIRAEISRNLAHTWSVSEMARSLNISEAHFIKLFRQHSDDVTPFEFLTRLRMERAKAVLETTFLRIKEIAVQIGIPNESQFTREFKKRFGLTPTEYRKRHWEIERSIAPQVQE